MYLLLFYFLFFHGVDWLGTCIVIQLSVTYFHLRLKWHPTSNGPIVDTNW